MTKVNVLLQGDIATGKTYSLRTLIRAEIEPFIISMEPGLDATLGDCLCPNGPAHHHFIKPSEASWDVLRRYILLATELNYQQLMKSSDPNRHEYTQYLQVFQTCRKFVCDGCGGDFGPVDNWSDDRAIVIDGLTGLTRAARQMWIGARPVIGENDYQPIQGYIEAFLELFWSNTPCSAILIAHTDMRPNRETGINQLTIDTAGPALVRKLVRKPDEIITTEVDAKGNYTWNTLYSPQTVTKGRRLPRRDDLEPSFAQLFSRS